MVSAHSSLPRRKVLLVGWDAADWKFTLPLLEAGGMPTLASLVERGVMGNIATLQPPLSPLLWTSIATGKLADQHGVLGFLEPDPLNSVLGVRPVSVASRRAKALWNVLDASGLDAHVVGWYASHPAENLRGVSVSNRFFEPSGEEANGSTWNIPVGSVAPAELAEPLAGLRVKTADITPGQLRELLPELDAIDQRTDRRPKLLAEQLARTASTQAVATAILQQEPWDFLGVYFDGIDVLGHYFMPYHPPRMPGVSARDFALYAEIMTRVYQFHDLMLGRLLQLAGPDVTVIVTADHGFHCDGQRPAITGDESPMALDAAWHRTLGLFCAAGPGLKRDERVYGASILDVAPTILTLFGLPVGEDMDGRVMVDAFEEAPSISRVPTWEDGTAVADAAEVTSGSIDHSTDRAVIEQFVALGYLEALSPDAQRNADAAERENRLSLATVYLSTRRPSRALPLLEALHAEQSEDERVTFQLGQCLANLGRAADCAALLEAHSDRETGQPATRAMLLGSARLALGEAKEAQRHFAAAEALAPGDAGLIVLLGGAYLSTCEWDAAGAAFRRALTLDPDQVQAHDGLAVVHFEKRRYHEAAHAALEAVGRLHFFPEAHFHLGLALVGLGDHPRAIQAFETSLAMAPGHRDAHRWAATLYRKQGNREKAAEHRRAAEALAKDE